MASCLLIVESEHVFQVCIVRFFKKLLACALYHTEFILNSSYSMEDTRDSIILRGKRGGGFMV